MAESKISNDCKASLMAVVESLTDVANAPQNERVELTLIAMIPLFTDIARSLDLISQRHGHS